MALGVSPDGVFRNCAINDNATEAANALMLREAAGIG
jgi:hypothetical protein